MIGGVTPAPLQERYVVRLIAVGTAVVAAFSAAGMTRVVVQPNAIALPDAYRFLLWGVLGVALLLGVSAIRGSLATVRAFAAAFVVAAFLAYATLWPALVLSGTAGRPGQLPWILSATVLPVVAAAIAWGSAGSWSVLGIVTVIVPALRTLVGDGFANAVANDLQSIAFSALFCVISTTLLTSARAADRAAETARAELSARTEQLARDASRVRAHAFIHDEVLATLNFASRATPEMRAPLAGQADRAIGLIARFAAAGDAPASPLSPRDQANAGETPTGSRLLVAVEPSHRLDRLAHSLAQLAAEHGAVMRVHTVPAEATVAAPEGVLPAEAAAALLGAVRQALVNASAHAGIDARIVVSGHLASDAVTLLVEDDGVGFDPSVSSGRMGVPLSILARMRSLPGGSATVRSAPGRGTLVSVSWSALSATEAPRRKPARPRRTRSVWRSDAMAVAVGAVTIVVVACLAAVATVRTGDPIACLPAVPLVLATVLLSRRATVRLSGVRASGAAALTVLSASLLLLPVVPDDPLYADAWFIPSAAVVLALVAFRGHPSTAVAGVVAVMVTEVVVIVVRDLDVTELVPGMVRATLAVAIAAAMVLTDDALQRRAERDRTTAMSAAEDRAWAVATTEETRARGAALADLVIPLLERIAAGEPLDEETAGDCVVLEGRLRDAYRSGRLAREPLVSAAAAARRRGIDVVLVDDVPEHVLTERTLDRIAQWMGEALGASTGPTFAGRILPAGRSALATCAEGDRATSFGG